MDCHYTAKDCLCARDLVTMKRWHHLPEISELPETKRVERSRKQVEEQKVTSLVVDWRMPLRAVLSALLTKEPQIADLFTVLRCGPTVVLLLHVLTFAVTSFWTVALHE
jgi:hypothetical protein